MAQPARPRPRPRLVSRQPAVGSETKAVDNVNDEDDLFRRNRGRTAQQWKQLEQSAAKATPFTISDDEWDMDDRDDAPSKSRKKKRPIKQNDRPRWQATDVTRMARGRPQDRDPDLFSRLSSDNEDDDVQIVEHTVKNSAENTSLNKRKRERSRSRSITPPPKLTEYQRANAKNLVRQALSYQPRPPSPTLGPDDPTDVIELDPELARITETARKQAKHAQIDPERAGGPETVNINVRWRPHPLNRLAEEQCWTFRMRRHDTFRELFDEVADQAGVMTDRLVITHDRRRVFASGTPHSLHIWAEGEMEACDRLTAEYLRAQKLNRPPSPSYHESAPGRSPSSSAQSDGSGAESAGDTIKLIFRSAATKDRTFPLTVRSTTTCGAIVRAFLKVAELPDNHSRSRRGKESGPYLMVDGDKMDSDAEIGDADLEDGDLVEVTGV